MREAVLRKRDRPEGREIRPEEERQAEAGLKKRGMPHREAVLRKRDRPEGREIRPEAKTQA